MKKILGMFAAVMMLLVTVPMTTYAATEDVTMKVTADKSVANPEEAVNFSVSIGAVQELGVLEFDVQIPEGLTINEESIKIPEGLAEVIHSDGDIVVPAKKNNYKWSYSATTTAYQGTTDLVLLTFSCTVDKNSTYENKTVGLTMEVCCDNTDLLNHNVMVTPAVVSVEKKRIPVSGIVLDKTDVSLKDGETIALQATIAPGNADNQSVSWKSDKPEVATVENGVVTAIKEGTATVTVTTADGGKTAICIVTVTCKHSLKKVEAVAPTCVKDGNVEHYNCSKCGRNYKDTTAATELKSVLDKATGIHNQTEVRDAVEATEEMEGYTGNTYCKVCDKKLKEGTIIAKLSHTHVMKKTDAVEATCEENGNIDYYTCTKCGKKYTDEAGKNEVSKVEIEAIGHRINQKLEKDEENHWNACTVCLKEINKVKHTYKWVIDKAATEDAIGLKHEECECGSIRSVDTEIPKLDHVHTDIRHYDEVKATCMKEGNVEYWTCSSEKCTGKYYGDKECQAAIEDIVVPKDAENHEQDGEWEMSETEHERTCLCGEKVDKGEHAYDNEEDAFCNVCNYQRNYVTTWQEPAVFEQTKNTGITFRVDGALSLFKTLEIDGKEVPKEYYTLKEGSTIITVMSNYLNTLSVGSHAVKVFYLDNKVSTTSFTVKEPVAIGGGANTGTNEEQPNVTVAPQVVTSPRTGEESSNYLGIILLTVLACGGLVLYVLIRKRACR